MAVDTEKRPPNYRAFVTVMAGLAAVGLPISGLILHAHSDGEVMAGRHAWLMMHVFLGVLFLVFVAWHVVLNRRPLLKYLKLVLPTRGRSVAKPAGR